MLDTDYLTSDRKDVSRRTWKGADGIGDEDLLCVVPARVKWLCQQN